MKYISLRIWEVSLTLRDARIEADFVEQRDNACGRKLNIAMVGPNRGNHLLRAHAVRRIGHRVQVIDPVGEALQNDYLRRWSYKSGAMGVGWYIDKIVRKKLLKSKYDLIIVNQGEYIGRGAIRAMAARAVCVNYMNDDPYGGRDGSRFNRFMKAIPEYDLHCVVRNINIEEAYAAGAKNVMRVFMCSDDVIDRPKELSIEQKEKYGCDVSFIGNWMPERGVVIKDLLASNVPVSFWGDGWSNAPEWKHIEAAWKGPAIRDREEYAIALQASKISIGLVSSGNRDEYTTRSLEIPSNAVVFCAQRTGEHSRLYKDRVEAVFWETTSQCAALCHELLSNKNWRQSVRAAGHLRAIENNITNFSVMSSIVSRAGALLSSKG